MIILELLDHLGRIKERHQFSGERIRVGRAYDNDLILNDPFVCPQHLEIEPQPDGSLKVNDLNSLNGLYAHGAKRRVESLLLDGDEKLRIGHTILRYRSPQHKVAATRQDRLSTELVNNLLNSPLVMSLGFLLLALFVALISYLGSYSEFEALDLFRNELLPYAMVLLLWAGFWSLLSRITTHSFYFKAHSIITTAAIFVSLLYEELLDPMLRFAFNLDVAVDRVSFIFSLLLIAVALYAHLRFCSAQSSRRLAIYSFIIASVLMGTAYMESYEEADSFSSYPEYHSVMLPPAFQMVGDSSFEEFFSTLERLDVRLQEQIEQKAAEQAAD